MKKSSITETIRKALFREQDLKFRDFHCRLIPTVESKAVIGVRTPVVKRLAREFILHPEVGRFLDDLPHRYYDENQVHAFILSGIKDFDECVLRVEQFLPFVDNWATCDQLRPGVFARKKNRPALLKLARLWLKGRLSSGEVAKDDIYVVRFGIEMLMQFFLDEDFRPEYLKWVAAVRREDYYVKMMVAWYFATALAKQYESALPFVEGCRLERWTHNKAIQKAVESYRITPGQKEYLKKLKSH